MLRYTIEKLSKTTTVEIELIDNAFANKWKDYLIRTTKRLPNLGWAPAGQLMYRANYMSPINHFKKIKESFELLQQHYGFDFSSEISEIEFLIANPKELKQSHLNKWHRHFTTNAVEFVTNMETSHLIPLTDTPDDVIFAAIHVLNQYTHDLEVITYPKIERRQVLKNKTMYSIRSAHARGLDDSALLWSNGNQELITEDFTFDQEYHYTVWLADDIQGKDHFKCWYDEDDPTNEDIWGNTFMTPNIALDPDNVHSSTIDNPEFRKFVTDSGKTLNRYPIGNIVNLESIDWSLFNRGELSSIELDGEILWSNK